MLNEHVHAVRAFGGGPLDGDRVMRFVYLDESGTSTRERIAVVSGVCIDPDRHMIALEDRLSALADEYVPPAKRQGFVFHATELFSGGKTFDRVNSPPPVRWPILEKVVAIPRENEVTIVGGFIFKDRHGAHDEITLHAMAFLWCMVGIEAHMRTRLGRDEVAVLVVEDRPEARRALRRSREILASDKFAALMPPHVSQFIPLKRIRDTIHFAKKSESPLLQLADSCAFVVRRELEGAKDNETFVEAMLGDKGRPQFSNSTVAGLFDFNWTSVSQQDSEVRAGEKFHPALFADERNLVEPVTGPMSDWVHPDASTHGKGEAAILSRNPYIPGEETRVYLRISKSYEAIRVETGPIGVIVMAPPHLEADALATAKAAALKRGVDQIFRDTPE